MPVVLIVEDDASSRISLAAALSDMGMAVLTVADGEQAIIQLKKTPIDVVVTDVMMDRVDGLDLLGHIRQHYPKIPVILVTAFATAMVAEEARKQGAECLPKPIDLNLLEAAVLAACGNIDPA